MKSIFVKWLKWQFFEVPKNILRGWKNFLKFGLNYFSVPLLLKTLFSPWRKYEWFYPRGFDFWVYLEIFISNLIFRILGAMFRSILIVIGILFEVFLFFSGLGVFLGWLLLPFFLVLGIYEGFRLLLL